jgi:hypothetical protein
MPPTDEGFSRRARILKRVLQWVNQDRFEDYDSWMLFGNRGADTSGEQEELYERPKPEEEPACQMLGDILVDAGKVVDGRRTSLEGRPPRILGQDVVPADWRTMKERDPLAVAEALDATYSAEIVGKLETTVSRATLLAPHEVDACQAPAALRGYFKEVHNCFLYGFPIACAVLCRALLEAALTARFEPRKRRAMRKLSKDMSPEDRGKSTILRLLDRAQKKGILDGGRVEAGENVKDGGDAAIHRPEDFQKRWGDDDQLRRLVEDTRKVLEDLYRATHAT